MLITPVTTHSFDFLFRLLIEFSTGHLNTLGIAAVSAGRFDAVFAVGRVESAAECYATAATGYVREMEVEMGM